MFWFAVSAGVPHTGGSGPALGQTLALIAAFGGLGVLVNILVVYIIGQVLNERRQNQERLQRLAE